MNATTTTEPPTPQALAPATGSAATYWHEIPQAEQEKIIEESGLTVAQFLEKYKQPDWCEYPEALAGQMGCWSLILSRSIHCKADCGDCDCIAKPPNIPSSATPQAGLEPRKRNGGEQ